MVLNRDPLGIISTSCVYILLLYGDLTAVYYVIEYGQSDSLWKTLQALLMHVLLVLALVSHLRAVFSDPGYVPLSPTKIDFSSDLEKDTDTKKKKPPPSMSEWSVCTKCETFRPPRSHHCRKCGRCVRRMDHHCPWINNCVGQLNFKYFYLFVLYTGSMCGYSIILISIDWAYHWGETGDTVDTYVAMVTLLTMVLTVILFVEAVLFGMFTTAVGGGQTMATLCDRNAIELKRYGAPGKWTPYRTWLPNVATMCGRGSKLLWLLPCVSPRIPDPVPPTNLDASQVV